MRTVLLVAVAILTAGCAANPVGTPTGHGVGEDAGAPAATPPPSSPMPGGTRGPTGPAPCPSPTATNCDHSRDGRFNGTGTGAGPGTGEPPLHAGPYSSTGARDRRPDGCSGTGPVPLTVAPMKPSDYVAVLPYGLMIGGHVTPIDHMYLAPPAGSVRDQFEVRAMADGDITEIGTRPSGPNRDLVEYRIWYEHSCTFFTYNDLVTKLQPDILAEYEAAKDGMKARFRYPVKAGDVVGWIGAQTLDWGVYNDEKVLPGLLEPESYVAEAWKIHTDDPYLYLTEPARSELMAKNVRTAEPVAGRIDHDVDARLAGSWFAVGTNAYAGPIGGGAEGYWAGHLAIAPDAYLPDHWIVSLGDWAGRAKQFGIKGNGPDPREVGEATGLVRYELVIWNYRDGATGATLGHSPQRPVADLEWVHEARVEGTLLVQLTGARELKVEAFPGKAAADVAGFTGAARTYER